MLLQSLMYVFELCHIFSTTTQHVAEEIGHVNKKGEGRVCVCVCVRACDSGWVNGREWGCRDNLKI